MNVLPIPKKITEFDGYFELMDCKKIIISLNCDDDEYYTAKILKDSFAGYGYKMDISKNEKENNSIYLELCEAMPDQKYIIRVSKQNIVVTGNKSGLFYGVQTLIQMAEKTYKIDCAEIEDFPDVKIRGIYLDITRGKVPKLEQLKRLADILAKYKVNQLHLYVEHTFAYKDMSEAWRGSDPLSAEDILELDEYCGKRFIELVPAFASFGHLFHLLNSRSYSEYSEIDKIYDYSWFVRQIHHTIDISNPKSIQLIEKMISQTAPLFSSNKFNICCDETFDMCEGKSKALLKTADKGELYLSFVSKLVGILKKFNKTPMFYSDIVLKYPEQLKNVPDNTVALSWNYGDNPSVKDFEMIAAHEIRQYLCAGTSGWNRLICDYEIAFSNIKKMVSFTVDTGSEGFLLTDWGDMGHVNCFEGAVGAYIYGASLAWNNIQDFDYMTACSKKEYGTENICRAIYETGKHQIFNWADMVSFMLTKNGYVPDERDEMLPWVDNEFFKNKDIDKIKTAIEAAEKYIDIIKSEYPFVKDGKKHSILEILNAIEGVKLFNTAYLNVRKKEYDKNTCIISDGNNIAEKLELWFYEFERLWRDGNRESELYRVRDCIFEFCDYLRS